jgi:putative transposase
MGLKVESLTGAVQGERSPDRTNYRNGYRGRIWEIRAAAVERRIPELRRSSYFPVFLEPRRAAEKALAAVVQEAYVQGASTRSVDDLVKAMGMTGISKKPSPPVVHRDHRYRRQDRCLCPLHGGKSDYRPGGSNQGYRRTRIPYRDLNCCSPEARHSDMLTKSRHFPALSTGTALAAALLFYP